MLAHTYNASTWETKAGDFPIERQYALHSETEFSKMKRSLSIAIYSWGQSGKFLLPVVHMLKWNTLIFHRLYRVVGTLKIT